MDQEVLISRYPDLYHMAEDGSWESIRRLGLLSTSALLDTFEVGGSRRFEIESCRRPEIVEVRHPASGLAFMRDNKPMQEKVLRQCLVGREPREWYETLNWRVFFWGDRRRLIRLLDARPYRERPHLVLELETPGSIRRHAVGLALTNQLGRDVLHGTRSAGSGDVPPNEGPLRERPRCRVGHGLCGAGRSRIGADRQPLARRRAAGDASGAGRVIPVAFGAG